jgi:hypothetical protein
MSKWLGNCLGLAAARRFARSRGISRRLPCHLNRVLGPRHASCDLLTAARTRIHAVHRSGGIRSGVSRSQCGDDPRQHEARGVTGICVACLPDEGEWINRLRSNPIEDTGMDSQRLRQFSATVARTGEMPALGTSLHFPCRSAALDPLDQHATTARRVEAAAVRNPRAASGILGTGGRCQPRHHTTTAAPRPTRFRPKAATEPRHTSNQHQTQSISRSTCERLPPARREDNHGAPNTTSP